MCANYSSHVTNIMTFTGVLADGGKGIKAHLSLSNCCKLEVDQKKCTTIVVAEKHDAVNLVTNHRAVIDSNCYSKFL